MYKFPIRWLAGLLVTAAASAPVSADILNDILGISSAARDRATEARNNAASARDRATEARNNAATARDNAAAARDTALLMRDNMEAGLTALSDQIRATIQDAVQDLERELADELEGRETFLQGGAGEAFRSQLIALMERSAALVNAVNGLSGMPDVQLDVQREIDLIQAIPVRLLYPSYRVLSAESPGMLDRFNQLLESAMADIEVVGGLLLDDSETIAGDVLSQELGDCAYTIEHRAELKNASSNLSRFATAAKSIGSLLKAAGTTEIHKTGAVWGWVGVSLKSNRTKKLGEGISGLGTAVGGLNDVVRAKISHCTAMAIEGEDRARDQKLMDQQKQILTLLQRCTQDEP